MKRTDLHNHATNRSSHVNIWLAVSDHLEGQLYRTGKSKPQSAFMSVTAQRQARAHMERAHRLSLL